MDASKQYVSITTDSLILGNEQVYRQVYTESGIDITSGGTTTISLVDFFYPIDTDPLYESGELVMTATSATVSSCQVANFGYIISRSGSTRVGNITSGYGLSVTNGINITAVKSGDNLDITLKLTSDATVVADGELYVYKSNYLNIPKNVKTHVKKIEALAISTSPSIYSLTLGNIVIPGTVSSLTLPYTNGAAIDFDFTSFFSDTNVEIGEVVIYGLGTARKVGKITYTNYNTTRTLSSVYSYASRQPGGGGGGIFVASTVGTTLRINADFDSGTGSSSGTIRIIKTVFYSF